MGDAVWLKRTGERRRIVHVFSVHPFNKGDVVVLMEKRRERCSAVELEKAQTCMMPTVDDLGLKEEGCERALEREQRIK